MKSHNNFVKIVAVESAAPYVLSEGRICRHKIQGIGAGFVPDTLNAEICDEIIKAERTIKKKRTVWRFRK